MQPWRLPPILIIHLKRFSQDARGRMHKVHSLVRKLAQPCVLLVFLSDYSMLSFPQVDFPITGLDLKPFIDAASDVPIDQYDLFAVSNHHGILGGGHYVAHGLVQEANQWYVLTTSVRTSSHQPSQVPMWTLLKVGTMCVREPCRYNFNDGYVTPINPSDIVTPASYILFYRHRNLDAGQFPVDHGPPVFVPTEAEIERHRQVAASNAIPWWRKWLRS
eukprot:SAG31_NODE_11565_length_1017_cov_1.315904_1_plen_218_part_00